jgi:hypothetical protein
MEAIEGVSNRVVTECGHVFHCSCLMQNAAHNGFGCPYCRAVLAVVPEEDDSDYDEEDDESIFDTNALTSFRMFHQRIEGEEVDEEEPEEWETVASEDEDREDGVPNIEYITQKLIERGVTIEDLVKSELYHDHSILSDSFSTYERRVSEIFGFIRSIIIRYDPARAAELVATTTEASPTNEPATTTAASPTNEPATIVA